MSSVISCHHFPSPTTTPKLRLIPNNRFRLLKTNTLNNSSFQQLGIRCSSQNPSHSQLHNEQRGKKFSLKDFAISAALAVGLITGVPALSWSCNAYAANPALPDMSVLISGPPIKDPGVLLRYALPINNKAIRELQKPLEDITESLKVAGVKALDSVERTFEHMIIQQKIVCLECKAGFSVPQAREEFDCVRIS